MKLFFITACRLRHYFSNAAAAKHETPKKFSAVHSLSDICGLLLGLPKSRFFRTDSHRYRYADGAHAKLRYKFFLPLHRALQIQFKLSAVTAPATFRQFRSAIFLLAAMICAIFSACLHHALPSMLMKRL